MWTRGAAGEVVAYLRVLEGGGETRLGRIVTAPEHRGTGAGAALMRRCSRGSTDRSSSGPRCRRRVSTPASASPSTAPEYDEDGIPHVPMRRP